MDGGVFVVILELGKNQEIEFTKKNSKNEWRWNKIKVLIPENCLLWTNKGFSFPKDLNYGTEIFTIDPENKLVTIPIMEELEEPEEMKVCTIFTQNNISTLIPNYKIQTDDELLQVNEIQKDQSLYFVDLKYTLKFKEFHDDHAVEFVEKSPFSVMVAIQLGSCGIKEGREAVYFQLSDEETMRNYAKNLQDTLLPEIGGDVSVTKGVVTQSKWGEKDVCYLVLYRSEKFYKFRKSIKLTEDKILNSIYQNGLNIYFGFLRSLLSKGFSYHLNSFTRGMYAKNVILSLPWKSKIRKLLQNSCHLWNTYQLSLYQSKTQRNIDEVKIERTTEVISKQPVLEIKEHLMHCYEIEIPIGNKIIVDNLALKPFELTEEEIEDLKSFEEESNLDLEKIRKKITSSISSDTYILKTINQIKSVKKEFNLHIVGIIKNKGKNNSTSTRYGKTVSVNAILFDESGEIKMKLWGDIVNEIKDDDVLELFNAYTKNGILYNSKEGWERSHKNAGNE